MKSKDPKMTDTTRGSLNLEARKEYRKYTASAKTSPVRQSLGHLLYPEFLIPPEQVRDSAKDPGRPGGRSLLVGWKPITGRAHELSYF